MESSGYTMNQVSITAAGMTKNFNHNIIFQNISFSLISPSSLAITGKNGTGKSTLSKIIAGLISTTRGSVSYTLNKKNIDIEVFKHHIGFVSPYLNFYDEFTALENLQILSRIRTAACKDEDRMKEILSLVDLWQRRDDLTGTFSSGMKQRLKYAFALLHNPALLILDEPTSNMDNEGIEFVRHIVKQQKKQGVLIIATNKKNETNWCDQEVHLGTNK
jgi:heme exporter protein A